MKKFEGLSMQTPILKQIFLHIWAPEYVWEGFYKIENKCSRLRITKDFIINNIKIKWFDAEKLCVVNRMQLWHAGCYTYYRAYTTERAKEIFFCLCVKRMVILFYQYVFIELHSCWFGYFNFSARSKIHCLLTNFYP